MTCKKYNKIIMTHRKTSFGRPSITETVTVTVTVTTATYVFLFCTLNCPIKIKSVLGF